MTTDKQQTGAKTMPDEIWITKDGSKIAVADMTENHAKNALRLLLRKIRQVRQKQTIEDHFPYSEYEYERPDNQTILAGLRHKHGDSVRIERASTAGMSGGNVYVGGKCIGWFGGI